MNVYIATSILAYLLMTTYHYCATIEVSPLHLHTRICYAPFYTYTYIQFTLCNGNTPIFNLHSVMASTKQNLLLTIM